MGVSDARIGYFAAFQNYTPYQNSYTGGAKIDYAFKNDFAFGFVDASLSKQKNMNGLLIGSNSDEGLTGGNGNDFLWGLQGNDFLEGGRGNDVLVGGNGADRLKGGGGDDFIFFDAQDTLIRGGAGHDTAIVATAAAVKVNMTTMQLETFVGNIGADNIVAGDAADVLMIAGGKGADLIRVNYGAGQGTRILWGGDDADRDVFDFTFTGNDSGPARQLGVLVASVSGLTVGNFGSFNLSMLNLPSTFDWSAIDAVILNPQSQDRIKLGGSILNASATTEKVLGVVGFNETGEVSETVYTYFAKNTVQGTNDFLGSNLHIQSPEADIISTAWYRFGEGNYQNLASFMLEPTREQIEEYLSGQGTPAKSWVVDLENYAPGGNGVGLLWRDVARGDGTPDADDPWFVAGGAFNGAILGAVNAPSATMGPNAGNVFDWLV